MGSSAATHGAGPAAVREVNRSLVLSVIKSDGPISRSAIADRVGLTKPTVSSIVDALIRQGVVRETGQGTTARSGGRRPILLEYDAQSEYVLGCAIGVRRTILALADGAGCEVAQATFSTPKTRPAIALRRIGERANQLLDEAGIETKRLLGTTVAVPGLVDTDRALCLLAPNLGWRQVDIRAGLDDGDLGPVFVHNTTQAAAIAESVEGAAIGIGDLVYLHASTGVGASILVGGSVFHGWHGLAGEVGHCHVPGSTAKAECQCGKRGCLETVASGPAIARAAEEAVCAGRRTSMTADQHGKVPIATVAAAAQQGDRLARRLFARAGEALGTAASWLVNVVDPRAVVVGGTLTEVGQPLLEPLEQALRAHVLGELGDELSFATSTLGRPAAARGAVLLARQHTTTGGVLRSS